MPQSPISPDTSYTCAIARFYRGNKVIGAGFVVDGGYLLTCAHVVDQALGHGYSESAVGATLKINLPFVSKSQKYTAEVCIYRPDDEDVAGLKLREPLPEEVCPTNVVVGHASGHQFKVYGFSRPQGIWARGVFSGDLSDGWVQMEDTKAQGYPIEPGFSGAPVWNEHLGAVVGMTVAREKDLKAAKVAFMIPARLLFPVMQELVRQTLLIILTEADVSQKSLEDAYCMSRPEGWTGYDPEGMEAMLKALQEMPSGSLDYPALQQFVGFLSLPELGVSEAVRSQLRAWLEQTVEDELERLFECVRQKVMVRQAPQEQALSSHLLIWVYGGGNKLEVKRAIYIPDYEHYESARSVGCHQLNTPASAESVDITTLPGVVRRCIDESITISPPHHLTVELLLPFELLSHAVDAWSTEDTALMSEPMGHRHRVIVRSSERLEIYYRKVLNAWKDKWKILKDCANKRACNGFISGDGKTPQHLLVKLRDEEQWIGLKLAESPQTVGLNSVFGAVLTAATPAAVWLRQSGHRVETPAEKIDALLGCCVNQVPEEVRRTRSAAALEADPSTHLGNHLSFLWEDPKLIPPDAPLIMP